MSSPFRSKRADTDFLFRLVQIVIAVILIFSVSTAVAKTWDTFFTDPAEKVTQGSFDRLADTIVELIDDDDTDFATRLVHQYYLAPGYIVVGFDTEWYDGVEVDKMCASDELTFGLCPNEEVPKPVWKFPACEGRACLCFYKDTWSQDFGDDPDDDNDVVDCRPLPGNVVIFGPHDDDDETMRNGGVDRSLPPRPGLPPDVVDIFARRYEYLFIYGTAIEASLFSEHREVVWEPKTLYVEKSTNEEGLHFIHVREWNDDALRRKVTVERHKLGHPACPESAITEPITIGEPSKYFCKNFRKNQVFTVPEALGMPDLSGLLIDPPDPEYFQCTYDETKDVCELSCTYDPDTRRCQPPIDPCPENLEIFSLCRCGTLITDYGFCRDEELYLYEEVVPEE